MVVRDPEFWRRFSVAVHQDDAKKEEQTRRPDLKRSYVTSPSFGASNPSIDLASPTSQTPLAPGRASPFITSHLDFASPQDSVTSLPAIASPTPLLAGGLSSGKCQSFPVAMSDEGKRQQRPKRQPSKLKKSPSTRSTAPLLPPAPPPKSPIRPTSSKSKTKTQFTTRPPSLPPAHHTTTTTAPFPSAPPTPSRYSLRCPSSLSLSGRPRNFKTWTTITGGADAKNRASWLQSQTKKRRQRAWMCWAFWIGIILIVAGVVSAVVVLRKNKII